ncbi:MAG: SOS response-associated peptidase family protein [Bacteroidota bacterium]
MCYSTQQGKPISELEKAMNAIAKLPEYLDDDDLQKYHINGFGKQLLKGGKWQSIHPLMLVQPQENPKYLTPLMWGLIPHWESGENANDYYKNSLKWGSGLNAQSEKLFSSNMYMKSAMTKRCVIPVTGFFEPHTTDVKAKGRPFKVPFFFHAKDTDFTLLAGIYAFASNGTATFSILTKSATPLFEKIHNTKKRRPVILHKEDVDGWLNSSSTREDIEAIIANDLPDESIKAYPVSKDVYSPKAESNRPDISDRVEYDEISIKWE